MKVVVLVTAAIATLAGLASAPAWADESDTPSPVSTTGQIDEGRVAWYGRKFAGRMTASGERFDPDAMTMAHRSWPFGTRVRVTNLANDRTVTVRVNDRGPTTPNRIADVSAAAARELDMIKAGVIEARLEVLE